jgi:hypothetical protein
MGITWRRTGTEKLLVKVDNRSMGPYIRSKPPVAITFSKCNLLRDLQDVHSERDGNLGRFQSIPL